MHGLCHAPGFCQVEISLDMLVLVVIFVWGFCGGNGIPVEGTEHNAKVRFISIQKVYCSISGKTISLCFNSAQAFVFFAAKNGQIDKYKQNINNIKSIKYEK
jgi:hypothetical protein